MSYVEIYFSNTAKEWEVFSFPDVDECATGNHTCHPAADCINTVGSFNCSCRSGYNGIGFNCSGIQSLLY